VKVNDRNKWLVFGLVGVGIVVVGCMLLALLVPLLGGGAHDRTRMGGEWQSENCPWCGDGRWGGGLGLVEILIIGFLILVVPLGLLALLALGIVWLVRSNRPTSECPNCGSRVEEDWKACPNCGERLED
jgi:hypothetical protein